MKNTKTLVKKVRLSLEEIRIIKKYARKYFGDKIKMILFGSRVNIEKRGGDIDLCIESSQKFPLQAKISFLAELKEELDDQKVDLILKTPKIPHKDIFSYIQKEGVEL